MRVYPIFIPHQGCPFRCVYCNQHAVTSSSLEGASPVHLVPHVRQCLAQLVEDARRSGIPGEIAFFGGTFTALPMETMGELLDEAIRWVRAGVFTGIRFSTRPDGINAGIARFLRAYPVQTVELGVQSLSDEVLALSRRGYSVETVEEGVAMVRENGWALGLQMMPGLPGDTRERFEESIYRVIRMKPAFVRIYPTLVLNETPLAAWYRSGTYNPLTLDQAIQWCVPAYDALSKAGIAVARMGLHADPELRKEGSVLAGPYHPSFGYLVRVYWWRYRVDHHLGTRPGPPNTGRLVLHVSRRSVSEAVGPGRGNVSYWRQKWKIRELTVMTEPDWPPTRFECYSER
jgi:histone acetyltransferase (RNA polymerase elongator complex component)